MYAFVILYLCTSHYVHLVLFDFITLLMYNFCSKHFEHFIFKQLNSDSTVKSFFPNYQHLTFVLRYEFLAFIFLPQQ
jgi:hypothetical protein